MSTDQRLNAWGQPRISSRFDGETTAMEVATDIDLTGKTAVVTGAGGGIGVEIAKALGLAGAKVVVADIDAQGAGATAATINRAAGADRATAIRLDLGNLADVHAFAEDFVATGTPLDILINNAGLMAPPLKRTADGHELQLGVNHLGHAALTLGLMPALKAAGGRVVCVSSIGHRRSGIIWDDPDYLTRDYDRWEAYGQSKTACALFAMALNTRVSGEGVTVNAMNPGGSMTGLQRFISEEEQRQLGWIDDNGKILSRWRCAEQCAATSVWIVTAPELDKVGGRYFENCNESGPWHEGEPMLGVQPHLNSDNADRLWDLTQDLLRR